MYMCVCVAVLFVLLNDRKKKYKRKINDKSNYVLVGSAGMSTDSSVLIRLHVSVFDSSLFVDGDAGRFFDAMTSSAVDDCNSVKLDQQMKKLI